MEVSNGCIKGRRAEKAFTEGLFIGIFDKFLVREAEIDLEPVFHRRKDPSGIFFRRRARGEQDRRIFFLEELKAGPTS